MNKRDILNALKDAGWNESIIGYKKSGSTIRQIKDYFLVTREQKIDDIFNLSSNTVSKNLDKSRLQRWGSQAPMGTPQEPVNPNPYGNTSENFDMGSSDNDLPHIGHFEDYPSLMYARPNAPCILIGYDSVCENLPSGEREMLSWEFSVVHENKLIELCFIKENPNVDKISFSIVMACILDYLHVERVDIRKVRRYRYCDGWNDGKPIVNVTSDSKEALNKSIYVYRGDRFTQEKIEDMPDKCLSLSKKKLEKL